MVRARRTLEKALESTLSQEKAAVIQMAIANLDLAENSLLPVKSTRVPNRSMESRARRNYSREHLEPRF